MHVRAATTEDVPDIVAMAERFYAETHYAAIVPLARESAAGLALLLIERGVMLVAVHDGAIVGMVGLFLEPFTFNVAITVATELVWWVNPEARETGAGQALLEAIESACRARGADLIRMMTLHSSPPHAAALYARRGYVPTEHAYTKEIR
jgi:GNAT superfamily N-acetyltransferase